MYSWLEALCLESTEMIVKVLPSIWAVCGLGGMLLYLEAWSKVSKSDSLILISRL